MYNSLGLQPIAAETRIVIIVGPLRICLKRLENELICYCLTFGAKLTSFCLSYTGPPVLADLLSKPSDIAPMLGPCYSFLFFISSEIP